MLLFASDISFFNFPYFNFKMYSTVTSRVPVEGEIISVCDFYEIKENDFNYYHYQPGSNIVYCKHTCTHSCTHRRPPTTVDIQVVAVRWVGVANHDKVNAPFRRFR